VEKAVGFVGLGIMGAFMAGNLLEAGHELVVHNRNAGRGSPLRRERSRRGATLSSPCYPDLPRSRR
jgi:2-hydroxy-3-oxopropionate reductase